MIEQQERQHVSVFTPVIFITVVILSFIGAIIGIQIILTLGVSANTSIIGAVLAILLSKLPIASLSIFKNLDSQNLAQTAISGATFSAANGLLVSIGVPWALGMPELVWPMLAGASIAILIDGTILYGMFNTQAYPASGPWPAGVATAETLWASDEGGKKLWSLLAGFGIGMGGAYFGIPMASAGIAFIGSMLALFMFAIGLLARGYSESGLLGYDLNALYAPHGFMIGAGMIALVQICLIIFRKKKEKKISDNLASSDASISSENSVSGGVQDEAHLESSSKVKKTLIIGAGFYFCTALFLTVATQIFTEMSLTMTIGFLVFAMVAAITQEMIVGMAAMHSGWFPATAAALISLIVGMLIGFPPAALAVLVGFCVATGPSFADLGFDLKTGFMIRGMGKDPAYEKQGRRQQYYAALIGFVCAIIMVALTHEFYFEQDRLVPASRLYAATIEAGTSPEIAMKLLLWAIPGALLQLIGGARNQLGILFSTGLMIHYPIAGWTVLIALIIRFIVERGFKLGIESTSAFAGGLIAGDALFSAAKVFLPAAKAKLLTLFIK